MKDVFVENGGSEQRLYSSVLVPPKNLSIFNSKLSIKIIEELAKNPACAMDLSRKLKEHEQKIYYHLKRMKDAGILKLERSEARYGMTAKIYSLVSPVVATKLYDEVQTAKNTIKIKNQNFLDFMYPFILDDCLNAKIVIGDTNPHGRFDISSNEGPHIIDFSVLLGNQLNTLVFPFYKLDTEVSEKDLKENLILFGNPKSNTIIDTINSTKKYFVDGGIASGNGKIYSNPLTGIIVKTENPFNKNKKLLLIGGIGRRGLKGAIIAITQNLHELMINFDKTQNFLHVTEALDKKGDGRIDAVKIME